MLTFRTAALGLDKMFVEDYVLATFLFEFENFEVYIYGIYAIVCK